MVLITPYRPLVAPIPQETPYQVGATIGSVPVTPVATAISAPPATRQTVLSGNFASNYQTAIPWDNVNNSFNPATMSVAHTTLLGGPAIEVTWQPGASTGDRFGGRIDLPGTDIGPEAWFTFTIMFNAGFSPGNTNFGGKLPGLGSVDDPTGCLNPVPCDGGWSARHMWRALRSGKLRWEHYMYHPGKSNNCGDQYGMPQAFDLVRGQAYTIEQHIVISTASGVANAVIESRLDGVLASVTPGLQFYCGGEGNRTGALIGKLNWNTFWGGSGSAWSPQAVSKITYGPWSVEIPA